MYSKLKSDKEATENILAEIMKQANNYIKSVDNRFVSPKFVNSMEQFQLPQDGLGAMNALKCFNDNYEKFITATGGPRYFGYVVGGTTPAAVIGDILTTIYDQCAFGLPTSLDYKIETETLNMLKDLLGIDSTFSGTFVTGATMSNFVGLANARGWVAKKQDISLSDDGMYSLKKPVILAAAPHSSIFKAIDMLGLGRKSVNIVANKENCEVFDVQQLRNMLELNKNNECIVIASAGTVNTGDFDNIKAIAKLKDEYDFWLHVDGAFGGIAACSAKFSSLLDGINFADSITLDAHKWLNVPYDCAVQFTKHKKLQSEIFFNGAAYLGDMGANPAHFNLTPENSRRFRALPLWFSLMAYGKNGYTEIIERNCAVAKEFANRLEKSNCFTLLAEPKINIVCFTLNIAEEKLTTSLIAEYLNQVNETGKAFFTSTIFNGKPAIRIAVSNWKTTIDDLEIAWECLIDVIAKLNKAGNYN